MGNISVLNGHTIKDKVARKSHDELVARVNEVVADIGDRLDELEGNSVGGSTGGDAIIDVNFLPGNITKVVALPTENIDKNARYGVIKVNSWVGGVKNQMPNPSTHLPNILSGIPITVNVVETLPTVGEVATDNVDAPTRFTLYYKPNGSPKFTTNDDRMYAYLDGEWVRAETFFESKYFITYHSFAEKEEDIQYPDSHNHISFMLSYDCYQYNGTAWKSLGESDGNETINKKALYRVKRSEYYTEGVLYSMGVVRDDHPVSVVESLPGSANTGSIYVQTSDMEAYIRTSDGKWKLCSEYYASWGGIVTDKSDIACEDIYKILLKKITPEPAIYYYDNGWVNVSDAVVEVDSLPNTVINEYKLYRKKTKTSVYMTWQGKKDEAQGYTLHFNVVPELPEVGLSYFSVPIEIYFVEKDASVRVWNGDNMTWWTLAEFISYFFNAPLSYAEAMIGGIYRSDQLPEIDPSKIYVVYSTEIDRKLYYYKNGWHVVGGNSLVTESIFDFEAFSTALSKDVLEVLWRGEIVVASADKSYTVKDPKFVLSERYEDGSVVYDLKHTYVDKLSFFTLTISVKGHDPKLYFEGFDLTVPDQEVLISSNFTLRPSEIIIIKRG